MAQVPFETASSNVASYASLFGLDKLAITLPSGIDWWARLIGLVLLLISVLLFVAQRVHGLRRQLLRSKWRFHFNPQTGATKILSFNRDGTIGEGGNNNETRWIVKEGFLDIIRANGDLQNRFRYHATTRRFTSTDDPKAKGIKGQFLVRPEMV
jgi:hypothetical protein